LISGALVGAAAASAGGGAAGYSSAYLIIALVAVVLIGLSFGLKGRAAEQATVQANASRSA